MNRTYEEILDSMKNAYFNECHTVVEDNSQALKRFEILASELYSLSCYGDYIFRQAFVQSATGESLDKLGELRGCYRKTATASSGELVFSVSQQAENDIIIPEGTVCSVEGKPYMQFATTQEAVIEAGSDSAVVMAQSLGTGNEYNVRSGAVTVMVNAPVGVIGVTNNSDFHGGYSEESDIAYRERIIRHYSILPNGINCTSNENSILELDYVIDCRIIPASDESNMIVYVATKSETLTDAQKEEIADRIPIINATGIDYEIRLAGREYYQLIVNAEVMRGFSHNAVSDEIIRRLEPVGNTSRIGDNIPLSRISKALADIDGLSEYSVYSPYLLGDVIQSYEYGNLLVAEIEVNCIYV